MARLVDFNQSFRSDCNLKCDVCVIGAGAAGLYLAHRLSSHGLRVIILEAGGATCGPGSSIGIEPVFSATQYRGALEGRAFGWGGSTSRWGGLLVAHSDLDCRDGTNPEVAVWRHIVDVIQDRSEAVYSTLGLRNSPDFVSLPEAALGNNAKLLRDCGLAVVAAEFLPFRRRNLSYLATPRLSRNVTVYLNAVAFNWVARQNASSSGTVDTVQASSQDGRKLRVSAQSFVVAAGAIESARILLEIDRSTHGRLFPRSARIGFNLSDHLSSPIADVHPEDQKQAAELFGPIFSKGRMRSFRFIENSGEPFIPRHFAHFIFEIDNPGFRFLKDVLSSLQEGTLRNLRLKNVLSGIYGLCLFGYSRFIKSTLFIPRQTAAHFQLDIEQAPDPGNRVHLGEKTDRFGRPSAIVHWNVSSQDYRNIEILSRRLLARWPAGSLGFPRLKPIDIGDTPPKPYDAYHPVGTCRMGTDSEATVDLELKVRGTQNLYVLSTGVFPSAGTANPTFSMLCLGDKLADKLAKCHTRF